MSGSKSSQASTTSNIDARRVLGEGSISNEGGDFLQTNLSYTLDGEVADKALSSAFNFGGNALSDALGFGSDALSKNLQVTNAGFDFAGSALGSLLDFTKGAEQRALDATAESTATLKNAYADAKGRGAMTDYLLLAALAVAGLVAWKALK